MANKRKNQNKMYKESIAYLIEDVMEKSEVVLAAQSIIDKLQGIAEDLSTIEAKEIMPILDSITSSFGTQVADQFNKVATEHVRNLITAVQQAKSGIDKEVLRMKQGIEGGDMSDMGMDDMGNDFGDSENGDEVPEPPMDSKANNPAVEKGKLPELPVDHKGNSEDDQLGFAGRARKESAKPRGKMIKENSVKEDYLDAPKYTPKIVPGNPGSNRPEPAIDQHPHKSQHFDLNIHNLGMFHGGASRLARNIEAMIDSNRLSGAERKKLTNVLSHFAAFASEPSHWANAERKLSTALEEVGLMGDDASRPEVSSIIEQLRKLAHLIANKHEGLTESAVKSLKESSDPDGLVLTTFRKKLAEGHDAQMSAIRTARLYGIDIEDVVSIVKEAAAKCFRCGMPKKDCKCKDKPWKVDTSKAGKKEKITLRDSDKVYWDGVDAAKNGKLKSNVPDFGPKNSHLKKSWLKGFDMMTRHLSDAKKEVKEWGTSRQEYEAVNFDDEGWAVVKVKGGARVRNTRKNPEKLTKAEAQKCATQLNKRQIKEFKMNTKPADKGMFDGENIADIKKDVTKKKKTIANAEKRGADHDAASKKLKQDEFAIRAKKSKGGKGWHKKVSEDQFSDNPMFPVGAGGSTNVGANITTGNGNATTGTKPPMTPADSRAQQMAQTSRQQGNNALNTPLPPTGGNAMVPPGETEVGGKIPPNGQRNMAPTQKVNTPAMPAGKIVKKI